MAGAKVATIIETYAAMIVISNHFLAQLNSSGVGSLTGIMVFLVFSLHYSLFDKTQASASACHRLNGKIIIR